MFKNFDWNTAYSMLFSIGGALAALGYVAKHQIQKHTEELKDDLSKIMYALYNDGKTGLINKVDQLIENQQAIKIDVEVMKAKVEDERR
jgi:hypothetical protein